MIAKLTISWMILWPVILHDKVLNKDLTWSVVLQVVDCLVVHQVQ